MVTGSLERLQVFGNANGTRIVMYKIASINKVWKVADMRPQILKDDVQSTKKDAPRSASEGSEGGTSWQYSARSRC